MSDGLLDVEILGDSRDIETRLAGMQRAFANDQMALWLVAGVDPILRHRTAERFADEGDDISGKWQSLKPYTVDERKRTGFPGEHPINVRTGSLKKHLLESPPRVATHTLGATMWSPGGDGGGDTANKVKIAQQGGKTPEGWPVPARPVLGVGPMDLEVVLLSLAVHIARHQPGASGGTAKDFMS